MKELFNLDMNDYNLGGKVYSRPSARAIIYKNEKVLLVYSKKYNYYKFPGGGIENGEMPKDALVREVREETGYCIIPESIEEYGRVLRRQKDSYDENGIFEQENLYFFASVSDCRENRELDPYEEEEGFTPVWTDAVTASRHNEYEYHPDGADSIMIKRDAKILDMVDLEIRRREREISNKNAITKLGKLDYQEMLDYVEQCLEEDSEYTQSGKNDIAYSRFEHTKRVLAWVKRLYDMSKNKENLRYEDLIIATIFHDVGRTIAVKTGESHAKAGVPITMDFLLKHEFPKERAEYICELVKNHSDKERMKENNLDANLLMLMEADLLDDMGALGIVMDCMITEARNPEAKFTDCLDHIMRFTHRIQNDNPMVTDDARQLWDAKTKLVCDFTNALRYDIEM